MDQRAIVRAAVAGGTIAMIVISGCSSNQDMVSGEPDGGANQDGGNGPNYSKDGGVTSTPNQFSVKLVPDGVAGMQRVNFAVPFSRGALSDETQIKILAGSVDVPAARRGLARYADGSLRSVQIQIDVDVTANPTLDIEVGTAGAGGVQLAAIDTTLTGTGNNVHPKVWVLIPSVVLASSSFAGPLVPRAEVMNTPLDAWTQICNYDQWNTDAFLVNAAASRDVWLYDRVTAMVRGHVVTGELSPLKSAYREAVIYRVGMTITNGVATGIAVPNASTDLKYYYAQGMALHYLMTGDDRYREAAEAVSARIVQMWNPQYAGSDQFWTERHAGFALLAHEWAAIVSDDKAAVIEARAETAVTAFFNVQNTYPTNYSDPNARCFAHSAGAHGEAYGYFGCSPWMSAILAEALDDHGRRLGGAREVAVRASIAKLGRILARDGRDGSGKPVYWMGVGTTSDEADVYDEHWGETAYVTAMAWDMTGRTDTALKAATDQMITGLKNDGVVGQVRSFNWQCRGAVMAPAFLK